MTVVTASGVVLTEADLDRLADEAEAGYDVSRWVPRPGRPRLWEAATEHSPRVAVRVPADLRDRVVARAESEGRTISEVVRALLEEYAGRPKQP